MRRIVLLLLLLVAGVAVWRLGERLSADALGMAIGIVLGVLAGIPASLLIVASGRRRENDDERSARARVEPVQPVYQPPVIVLTGHAAAPGGGASLDSRGYAVPPWSQTQRRFKLVGEEERWIE
ncbi:MAG: hypothetical protein NZ553_10115 [Caldilinea sp.]|nr:hypothetical protein [Caldilinea sp.]MDW8440817.1 hypothetical protein [Caldilineaceae bacterium]